MAKLFLRYEGTVLNEITLAKAVVTIGRLPDNLIGIENLAVSSHHARILWRDDQYFLEDNNSLNGTYINNRRVNRSPLKDGDVILVGRHTLVFKDDLERARPRVRMPAPPVLTGMDETMVLASKKPAEEMREPGMATAPIAAPEPVGPPGVLTVLVGKTDKKEYVMSEKLTIIGGSKIADIRIKGWFVPDVLAIINRRGNKYFVSPQKKDAGTRLNDDFINGQKELKDGDVIHLKGLKLIFGLRE